MARWFLSVFSVVKDLSFGKNANLCWSTQKCNANALQYKCSKTDDHLLVM